MKFKFLFLIIMVSLVGLSSCTSKSMIQPGDKIGDMIVSNDLEIGIPNLNEICTFSQLTTDTCEISGNLSKLGVSTAWGEKSQEDLEEKWPKLSWKVTIDGYPVDLEKFGTFDMEIDNMKYRAWNIAITNPTKGKHEVHYLISYGDHPDIDELYMFTIID